MKKVSFLRWPITALLLAHTYVLSAQVALTGRVTETGSGDPLPDVSVSCDRIGAVTDKNGCYTLNLPQAYDSLCHVTFIYTGYVKKSIAVALYKQHTLDITLQSDQKLLNEVVVNGQKYDFGVKSPQMGAVAVSNIQIRRMPTVFGDPDALKTLQTTPGVQSGKSGNAGLMVRGGNYDQNNLMIDGAPLYSTEHIRGFVSAVNPDMVSSLAFYRGAFPARYSGRLSSIIDISATEGDFDRYHAELSAGLSMGRLSVSGPIVKGRTSLMVAGRMSYFDLIYQPIVKRHYDKIGQSNPYADLGFWDINAKLVQKIGSRDRLTLTFVKDRDKQQVPERNPRVISKRLPIYLTEDKKEITSDTYMGPEFEMIGNIHTNSLSQQNMDHTTWGNTLGALNWLHRLDDDGKTLHFTAAVTSYRYSRELRGVNQNKKEVVYLPDYSHKDSVVNDYNENSQITHKSEILNMRIAAEMHVPLGKHNHLYYGFEARHGVFNPRRQIAKYIEDYENWCSINSYGQILADHRDLLTITDENTTVGNKRTMNTGNVFMGDELDYGPLHANIGFNVGAYTVKNKTYLSAEPRLTLSMELWRNSSVKASVSRTSQGERLLSSTSIVSPNDIWVPVTDSVPPMKSTQYALSFNHQFPWGIDLSAEGYYKLTDGNIEYIDGTDFSDMMSSWERQITIGKARSYGVELLLQKYTGATTGWISYTWSRSQEKYDAPARAIEDGRYISAKADRPHNLSVHVSHRFNISRYPGNHIDLSGRFSLVSGCKVTIPDHISYSGMLMMADHYSTSLGAGSFIDPHLGQSTLLNGTVMLPAESVDQYMRFEGFSHRNNYTLPTESSLDISMSLTVMHKVGESRLTIGVTNLLNRKNVSNVYLAVDYRGQSYLKGVCDFPIMPAFSYAYIF